MPRSPGRTGHRWRQARKALLVDGVHCHLCGHPIDITIPWDPDHPDPGYGTLDHLVPLSADSTRAIDYGNLAPAHYLCNTRKGNRTTVARRPTSRHW